VDVVDYPNCGGKRYRPMQKPVELMEWQLRTFTNEGNLVSDPFAGTGSILVACDISNRFGISVELESKYYFI
jgi:site-specific DNA-methyltransferase (adenine-specific)